MKRVYSIISLLLLCAASAVIFTACSQPVSSQGTTTSTSSPSSQAASSSTPPSHSSSEATSSESSSQSSASQSASPASDFQPTPSDASGSAVGEQIFAGTVEDIAMGTLFVTSAEGQTVGFLYTEKQLSGMEDYRSGAKIIVYYTGTLNGADTSEITVLRFENAS